MSGPWWWPFNALFWTIPEISAPKLHKRLQEHDGTVLVLDVRSDSEYKSFRVDSAISAPVGSLREGIPQVKELVATMESRLRAQGKKDHVDVVCVCLSAHRSPPAARMLHQAGLRAGQLAYGMAAWRLRGLPTISGPGGQTLSEAAAANATGSVGDPENGQPRDC
jgi:rhodanese-related sulfurtransferase